MADGSGPALEVLFSTYEPLERVASCGNLGGSERRQGVEEDGVSEGCKRRMGQ